MTAACRVLTGLSSRRTTGLPSAPRGCEHVHHSCWGKLIEMGRQTHSRPLTRRAVIISLASGAACRNRTDDLLITSETLYRLS